MVCTARLTTYAEPLLTAQYVVWCIVEIFGGYLYFHKVRHMPYQPMCAANSLILSLHLYVGSKCQ